MKKRKDAETMMKRKGRNRVEVVVGAVEWDEQKGRLLDPQVRRPCEYE